MFQCSFAVTLGLLLLAASYTQEDEQVFLTGEEGVSLVGKKCPDTVNLTCKGVDLPFLRWTYDVDDEQVLIRPVIYPSDVSPSEVDLSVSNQNSPFLRIVIVDILQGQNNLADFSTIITVDLVKLAQQNVTFIRCGQLDNLTDSVAVNVSITKPSFISPLTLSITNVIATYNQSGSLDNVEVQWTRLKPSCPEFKSNLFYEVILNFSSVIHHTIVNHINCSNTGYVTVFTKNFVRQASKYEISVRADDFLKVFPICVEYQRQAYFTPKIVTTSCHITAQCKSSFGYTNEECMIMYSTTDPPNESLPLAPNHTVPMDTFILLPYLIPGLETYYIHFTVLLKGQLSIKEIVEVQPMLESLVPDTPESLSILGIYSNRGQLEFMEVTWLNIKCDSIRGSPVHFNLVLSDFDGETLQSTEMNPNECNDTTCFMTIPTAEFSASLSVELTLAAVNMVDTSLYLPKPQIYQTSAWYYRPQITFVNCSVLQVSCTTSKNVDGNTACIVYYYGEDSQYKQVIATKMLSNYGTTEALPILSIKTAIHYLAFYLNVSEVFQIQDQFIYSIGDLACLQDEINPGIDTSTIIIVVGSLLGLLCFTLVVIILAVFMIKCIQRRKKHKLEVNARKNVKQDRAQSPEYEEINERIYTQINIKVNEAYVGYSNN